MGGIGPEWIVVGIVAVVVLFGAKKLPEIARSLGKSQSEFKKGMKEGKQELDEDEQARADAARAEAARTEAAVEAAKAEATRGRRVAAAVAMLIGEQS
jgi:sec-independent protein translocase protein TatA